MREYSVIDLLEIETLGDYIPTGSIKLDKFLGGGLQYGSITELFGDVGSGKTRVCLELLVNAVVVNDYRALYISTKGDFFPEILNTRIEHIVKTMNQSRISLDHNLLNSQEILSRIHYMCADNKRDIHRAIEEVIQMLIKGEKMKLIIIDAFSEGIPSIMKDESFKEINKIFDKLDEIASKDVAIFLTSNVAKYKICMADGNVRHFISSVLSRFRYRVHQSLFVEEYENSISIYIIKTSCNDTGYVRLYVDENCGLVELDDDDDENKEC